MPQEKRYKQGSVIYFDHETGGEIYLLKAGRLDISFIEPQSNEKINKTLNQGEFFGLKSAIIGHSRDEIAQAITDCSTICFNVTEFEKFVALKVDLLKRLLQVLSSQLRNLGFKVNNYLGNNVLNPPNVGLFKIGEYYLNNRKFRQAIQVYERYIESYGDTNLAKEAKYRIELAQEAIKTGLVKKYKPVDEILESEGGGAIGVGDVKEASKVSPKGSISEFQSHFNKGQAYFTGGVFEQAEKEFIELFKIDSQLINKDLLNKAKMFYIQTLQGLKKYPECIKLVTEFVGGVKDPTLQKQALFVMGDIYKDMEKTSEAKMVYMKIQNLAPADHLSRQARDRIEMMNRG